MCVLIVFLKRVFVVVYCVFGMFCVAAYMA